MGSNGVRRRSVAIALAAVAVLSACSGSDGSDGATGPDRTTTNTSAATTSAPEASAGPETYAGDLDGFYAVPDPLPAGDPGDLIRVQEVAADAEQVTVRVMYHSVDATGADRAATGTITYPTAEAPEGGWPVVSTAHGTTGIASPCAPSRTGAAAPGWGVPGVWAMTDYLGLGPIGELHAYLDKAAEGNAVIDIVRAAGQIDAAHAGTQWVAVGHSQGGHGALAAHELAAERARELELMGTVALAPAALLDQVYGGIDPIVTAVLTVMGLYGGQAEHPEVDLADHLTPEAIEAAKVMETGCLDEITEAMVPVVAAGAFTADPRQTEPARSILLANDVGDERVEGVPLFLASGTKDDRVVIDRFLGLAERVCAARQLAEIHVIGGATHDSIIPAVAADVTRFLTDALAGRSPADSCALPESSWGPATG